MNVESSRLSGPARLMALAFASAACLGAGAAHAQCDPAIVAHLGGWPTAIALRGTTGFLGLAGEIRIVNLANPAAPTNLGTVFIPGTPEAMDVAGNYLYAACDEDGLVIVDITTLSSPTFVTAVVDARTVDVAAAGNLAFVCADFELKTYDVTNPAAPVRRSSVDFAIGWYDRVVCNGTTAYAMTQVGDINAIDATNPAAPVLLDALSSSAPIAEDLALRGNLLAVSGWDHVDLFNVANPAAMTIVSTLPADSIGGFFVSIVQDGPTRLLHYAYDSSVLRTYDITNAASPVLATQQTVGSIDTFAALADMVYVGNNEDITAYDYSAPTTPVTVLTSTQAPSYPEGLVVVGQYLVVADSGNLLSYDISNPAAPTLAYTQVIEHGAAEHLAVEGRTVYTIDRDGVQAFDYTNPAAPVPLGSTPDGEDADNAVARDGIIYASDAYDPFTIYDATNPASITVLASLAGVVGEWIGLIGHHALVADDFHGVRVIDVADPANPVLVATHPPRAGEDVVGFALRGTTAIVAQSDERVQFLDVSDPVNPIVLSSIDFASTWISRIALVDSFLMVSLGNGAIRWFDVADPGSPVQIASERGVSMYFEDVVVGRNTAWVASPTSGVQGVALPGEPRIAEDPADMAMCFTTPSVDFTVTLANPAGATYQWTRNGVNVSNGAGTGGATFGGATTRRLTISNPSLFQVGEYRCVVTNACGTTTTSPASLAAAIAPSITQHPQDAIVCPRGSVGFDIQGVGTLPVAYQWQAESPLGTGIWFDLVDGVAPRFTVAGATQRMLSISANPGQALPNSVATNFRCVTTNLCGTATSNPGLLRICLADVDDGSSTGACDNAVTIDDLLYYLVRFGDGNAQADVDDGTGTGTQDGGVDISDLLYYLVRFDAGC